ncbi:universal stress protein [Nonomuraea cavernae]|uniref:Universal stress protein n=1 Tax=Nonomuraea cavernae TaxID=2045107 RepID=A0A917Z003_9ACTN|nr:universal stress protein [Nonomuraea cavernae]MCA2185908.1 universal stress protein [Nonomuraea cavernae]GGO69253.1 universal stress protein [Nonomuraea cavernae]
MSRPIVVGVDGSESAKAALDWAIDDAARRARPLRIVHVREPWKSERPFTKAHEEHTRSEQEARLLAASEAHARTRAPGLNVTTAHLTGAVTERLLTESETADTLVVGNRGLGGFAGLVLGSVGLHLAGHAHSPLVIVRAPAHAGNGEVVAAYDGSDDADAALEYALKQAAAIGARVLVVYAERYPSLGPQGAGYGPLLAGAFADMKTEIRQRLVPWREKYPGVEIVESIVEGHPVPILAAASRTADLIVIGPHGLGGFASAVLGSVTHGVIHRVHCPVAVIRAPWRPS